MAHPLVLSPLNLLASFSCENLVLCAEDERYPLASTRVRPKNTHVIQRPLFLVLSDSV